MTALLGLSGGGQAIKTARDAWSKFLETLVIIAGLQTQFVTLDHALKVTNRRVNALEFIMIPRILGIVSWIDRELDEEAREDFFRLKKVTDNKKKAQKVEESAAEGMDKMDQWNEPESVLPSTSTNIGGHDSEDDDIFV